MSSFRLETQVNLKACKPWLRIAGFALGAALVGWAVARALGGAAWPDAAQVRWSLIGLIGLGVLLNLLLTALLTWLVTRPFDADPPVPPRTMFDLIAASALINYLPLPSPGIFARAACLKARHNLPLRQSAVITGVIFVLAAVVAGVIALDGAWFPGAALVLLPALSAATPLIARAALGRPVRWAWLWAPVRAMDALVCAARLVLAFEVLGHEPPLGLLISAAMAGQLVSLLPITPNGLGLREWVVVALTPVESAVGAAAVLIDRAVEAAVVVVFGLWGSWRLRSGSTAAPVAREQPGDHLP